MCVFISVVWVIQVCGGLSWGYMVIAFGRTVRRGIYYQDVDVGVPWPGFVIWNDSHCVKIKCCLVKEG